MMVDERTRSPRKQSSRHGQLPNDGRSTDTRRSEGDTARRRPRPSSRFLKSPLQQQQKTHVLSLDVDYVHGLETITIGLCQSQPRPVCEQARQGVQLQCTGYQRTARPGLCGRDHRAPPRCVLALCAVRLRFFVSDECTEYKDLEARVDALRQAHLALLK